MDLAIGELAVDVVDHFHHIARDHLFGVLIAGAILHVAEIAILTECGPHASHRGADILGLQNLEVSGLSSSLFRGILFRSILGTECGRGKQQSCG